MKKILSVLAGVGLFMAFAMPADASWNIRQKDNGSTVWTDGSVEVPTGDSGLIIPISSFANAITYYVVSHKPGKIKKYYAVNTSAFDAQSNSPTINISLSDGTTAAFTPISAGSTLTMTTAAFAGRSSSTSPNDVNVTFDQGGVIAVKIGGSGTITAVPGTVVIVVE